MIKKIINDSHNIAMDISKIFDEKGPIIWILYPFMFITAIIILFVCVIKKEGE